MIVGAVGCQLRKRPSHVLAPEQMTRVMIDLYLAEARIRQLQPQQDSAMVYFIPFERQYLDSLHLADSTLRASYAYYLNRPRELERIYDAVIDSLSLREQRFMVSGQQK